LHSLSLITWFIHIATLFEWIIAIVLITKISNTLRNNSYNFLSLAMLPNLASAMAAITWHLFDNAETLKGLVVLQAALTMLGNTIMAVSVFYIYQLQNKSKVI
tara:strand:+ start:657 stop:965 length:309 start_codon:yes stop_codon:yes gene_type:complete